MATWGGFSRDNGACRPRTILDGRIAPNDNLAHNNNNNNNNHNTTTTNNNNNNNNNHNISSSNGGGNHTNIDIAPLASASAHANTPATGANPSTSTSTRASTLNHYLFGDLNVPNVPLDFSITNNDTIPSRYSFSPLPSLSDDSLFATVGDTLSSPFHTTTNTANFPLLDVGGPLDSTLCTGSRELPRPLPYPLSFATTPTSTSIHPRPQTQTQTQISLPALPPLSQLPQLSHQPHHSGFGFPGQLNIPSAGYGGDHHFHAPPQNYQPELQPVIPGSSQNYYPFAAPSLPYIDTTPTVLPQPHMSNTNIWPNPYPSRAQPLPPRSIDDPYLAALVTQDFSSPSLPPLSHSTSPTTLSLSPRRQSKLVAAGQEMPPSSTRRRIGHRGGTIDLTKEEPDFDALNSGIDLSIPLASMPVTTRRRSLASADPPGRKRRPSVATPPSNRPTKSRRKEPPIDNDNRLSPFGEDDPLGFNEDGVETIDLCNATEVPAELMAPKVDNRVKIGNFQCVICMDDTTALTVTHCGHLFCSDCLHSSLHIDTMKRTCPVCRAKVELKDKNRKSAKSYFHLELKVMTATKKGKRPVGV
ncbi:hypothetical protein F4803DRAFT_382554 [Xylaria telfairii]|nr:hypothetical protein F4803DRAFT_382554 [Xylaria telfairii]